MLLKSPLYFCESRQHCHIDMTVCRHALNTPAPTDTSHPQKLSSNLHTIRAPHDPYHWRMNGRMADQKNTTRVFYILFIWVTSGVSQPARGAHVLSQGPWRIIALNYIQSLYRCSENIPSPQCVVRNLTNSLVELEVSFTRLGIYWLHFIILVDECAIMAILSNKDVLYICWPVCYWWEDEAFKCVITLFRLLGQ